MKLLTEELRRRLPALYSTENDKDPIAQAKFFTPWTSWTWYATEFDGEDTFFGLVHGLDRELGYFSLSELEAIRGPGGLTIERDLYFKPTRLGLLGSPVQPLDDSDESLAPGFGRAPPVATRIRLDANATFPLGPSITIERTTSRRAPMRSTRYLPRADSAGPQESTQPSLDWSQALAAPTREPTKAELVRQTAEKAIEALAEALDHGRSEALTQYLSAMGRFHRYSFHNVLLIACQRPDATHVAGFHTWQTDFGRYVKAGEKGIAILAPMVRKARPEDADTTEEGENPARILRGFRVVYVFDVAQTDGKPLPEFAAVSGDPGERLDRLKALATNRGIELVYESSLGGASGLSAGGKILLLEGQTPAQEFSVLAHEIAHELLHKVDPENRPDKKTRETEAEAVAYVVTSAVGLNTSTAAADYIQLYRGDRNTLAQSLDRIQQTASTILEAVLPGT